MRHESGKESTNTETDEAVRSHNARGHSAIKVFRHLSFVLRSPERAGTDAAARSSRQDNELTPVRRYISTINANGLPHRYLLAVNM